MIVHKELIKDAADALRGNLVKSRSHSFKQHHILVSTHNSGFGLSSGGHGQRGQVCHQSVVYLFIIYLTVSKWTLLSCHLKPVEIKMSLCRLCLVSRKPAISIVHHECLMHRMHEYTYCRSVFDFGGFQQVWQRNCSNFLHILWVKTILLFENATLSPYLQ